MKLVRVAGLCAAFAILAVQQTVAQERGKTDPPGHLPRPSVDAVSPYAGMQTRSVKSLSEQQIADLNAGRGMGLALAAELNGYPGPSHVLDLADALHLSAEQRRRTQALLDAMKSETIPIGRKIIADETALNRLFAERRVAPASLNEAMAQIAAEQGQLRAAHLRYHLAMFEVLSAEQIARYAELRGYFDSTHHHGSR